MKEVLLNELVSRASCAGLHSFSRRLFCSEILENQICDPASAGFFEGRQIWEVRFRRLFVFVGLNTGAYRVFERALSLSESFENQICAPASAGKF